MYDLFSPLLPILQGFSPYLEMLKAGWSWISALENLIRVFWVCAWFTAVVVGMHQLRVVYLDWKAILFYNIRNGRRLIAWANLRTMTLLVITSLANLLPGIITLFLLPFGLVDMESARTVNLLSLSLAALLLVTLIVLKRRDRALWDADYIREHRKNKRSTHESSRKN